MIASQSSPSKIMNQVEPAETLHERGIGAVLVRAWYEVSFMCRAKGRFRQWCVADVEGVWGRVYPCSA